MQRLNKSITHAVDRPVKVMQFGEGNFLRAFVDYIFDVTNEKTDFNGGVVIVKPIEFGTLERFHDQECQYTLQLRGFVDGEPKEITRQITSVVDAVAAIEDYDKYIEYGTSETLEMAIGNPLYHWSHLELQRYFGYNGILNGDTAEEVWNLCNAKLQEDSMSVRNLIKQSNVTLVCTTDDPVDSLEWHQVLKDDKTFDVQVLPAWRPDKAMNIEKPEYLDYLETLSNVSGIKVNSFASLIDALRNRMDFFASMGCSVSDHALEYVMYKPYTEEEIEAIFAKRFSGSAITTEEMNKFKTAFMVSVGKEYNKRNWVMQLHYGTIRDNNRLRYDQLGPDTGYDCINTYDCSAEMAQFLNALNATDELPKTIIYSLNPSVNAAIGTVIGCFQDSKAVGKIQQGSAWWFNDHKVGMTNQMTSLANLSLLGNFIGMLTDSRSFLSYTRHEYFRRIMCELIGGWVENGEYPADEKALKKIVEGISYNNAVRYFGFDL